MAKAERLPAGERVPCVHLRTLFASPAARELLAAVQCVAPEKTVLTGGAGVRLALLWAERTDLGEFAETRELDLPSICSPRMAAVVAEMVASKT